MIVKRKQGEKKKLRGKEGANKSIGAHLKKHIYCKLLKSKDERKNFKKLVFVPHNHLVSCVLLVPVYCSSMSGLTSHSTCLLRHNSWNTLHQHTPNPDNIHQENMYKKLLN